MTEKITRTWKIDEDIVALIEEWAAKTHTPKGEAMQLGAWITMSLSPDERQFMLEMMDRREPIPIKIDTDKLGKSKSFNDAWKHGSGSRKQSRKDVG